MAAAAAACHAAAPEIRHVTLPTTGGRLIIASDGVWDHMQPKSMIHQVGGGSL
jgi:serine/threonine protein phosphatase PrpC